MKLRDALLDALSVLPGERRFHLHVLVSAPRKYSSLFPYATSRQRVYTQDILVLCSEQKDIASPRVLVSAIEAAVYSVPATNSAIFYVSKVDSTGQGNRPSPTATLARALLSFYINPTTRPFATEHLWVHLFARAQGQYLFPNSAEHPEKKPLSDVKLCTWWKRVYTQVAREVMILVDKTLPKPRLFYVLPGMDELEAKQALGELSVAAMMANASETGGPQWTYGHPYSQADIALPYGTKRPKDARYNLGQIIPSFDDDPKSRFMDEIACTTQVDGLRSPKRKRARASGSASASEKPQKSGDVSAGNDGDYGGKVRDGNGPHVDPGCPESREEKKGKGKEKEERVPGELGIVSADEFWERMSYRQECVAGAVTGFFVAIYSWPTSSEGVLNSNPLAPQPGNVSFQMVRRIVSSLLTGQDFATTEKTLRSTEVLEGAIKGLCSSSNSISNGGVTHHADASSLSGALVPACVPNADGREVGTERKTPERDLEPDSEELPLASRASERLLASPKTPPQRPGSLPPMASTGMSLGVPRFNNMGNEVSPNPFPEPIASEDTYHQFIYGSILVANPEALPPPPGAHGVLGGNGHGAGGSTMNAGGQPSEEKPAPTPTVTVLAVRKKKKR